MPLTDAPNDRLAAIAKLPPAELARLLVLQPHVAAWCLGTGTLIRLMRPMAGRPDRARLAAALASPESIRLTLLMLEPAALQLISVATSQRGVLSRETVDRELAPLPPEERERLVNSLTERLIIDPKLGFVALRPGVSELIGLPGRPLDRLLLDQSISSDHLATWLKNLNIRPIPARKSERIAAIHTVFANPRTVQELIESLTAEQTAMLQTLVDAGGGGISSRRLGVDWWQLRLRSSVLPRSPQPGEVPGATSALRSLVDLGLVWTDDMAQYVGLWLEVLTAINGRTYLLWSTATPPDPRPLERTDNLTPAPLGPLQSLLRQVADEPVPGLKAGGIGVKAIRDLARRIGQPEAQTALLARLANGTGLMPATTEPVGKGRQQTWIYRYELDRGAVAEWSDTDTAGQWRTLVNAWLEGVDVESEAYELIIAMRRQVVADLQALPPHHGVNRNDVAVWITESHFAADRIDVDALIAELAMLGLVTETGPVGLTSLARILLTDPASLAELLPEHDVNIVVQTDLTVVAPPALDPTIRSRLDQLCTVESSGSVTVLRLDRGRIAAALAAGETSAALLEFLHTHSSVPVPAVVARMLSDVERQRGGLTVLSATTVVTAHDVLGLAAAVKVKTARLTLIAPTVAISDLSLAKVLSALRAKGLAPANGTRLPASAETARSGPSSKGPNSTGHNSTAHALRSKVALHPQIQQLTTLVESW